MDNVRIGPCIGKILVRYAVDIGVILFAKYGDIEAKIKVKGIEKDGNVSYTLIESTCENAKVLPNPIDPIYLYSILD